MIHQTLDEIGNTCKCQYLREAKLKYMITPENFQAWTNNKKYYHRLREAIP